MIEKANFWYGYIGHHFNRALFWSVVVLAVLALVGYAKRGDWQLLPGKARTGLLAAVLLVAFGLGWWVNVSAKVNYIRELRSQCGTFSCDDPIQQKLDRLGGEDSQDFPRLKEY